MKKQFPFDIPCDEAKIQDTIALSKAAFLAGESEQMVSHAEFLYHQSKFIKKRWWFLQGLLLAFVCLFLCHMETDYLIRRALGLAGPLFVILILPELWKNRNFDAMEVECTTYYTIRSIYAARLTLFAGVDFLLLSAFFAVASVFAKITVWEMLIQFVLPFNVTCCICFRTLYTKRIRSEALAMLLCILWTGIWAMLILSNAVYSVISVPMWIAALAASVLGMCCTLCQGKEKWQQTLEVKPLWI
ncbi:MAG: hypothetical protein J6J12_08065 [Oscillospiraceae bacterium]|nr:hypothetical protein [Oscillospiraceae bacterium]